MSRRCTTRASGQIDCTRWARQSCLSGPRPGTDSRPEGLSTTTQAASRCTTTGPAAFTLGALQQMASAGIQFAHDPKTAAGKSLFVHTKSIISDAGLKGALSYVGSMNVGDQVSVNAERELGILLANTGIVNTMSATYASDWATATPVQVVNGQVVNPFPPPKAK